MAKTIQKMTIINKYNNMKLFKIILLIFVSIALTNCVATRKQKARFLSKYCERKDSISYIKKDSIVYRDSLVLVDNIINTPIYLENPCKLLCDSLGRLKPIDITKSKGGLKSNVKTFGHGLIITCQTDSLKTRITWLERQLTITENSHTENTVKQICELEHRTKWDGFTWYWFIITASILAIYILIKIFKGYLKAYLPFLK